MPKLLVALLLILLAGCAPSLPTPLALNNAAAQTAIEDSLHNIFPNQPVANVTVRHIEDMPDDTVAFFTYETTNDVGIHVTATGDSSFRRGWQWQAARTSTSTPSGRGPFPAIQAMGSGFEKTYVAHGMVHDPAVKQVAVTWTDGKRDVVVVENGVYYALRDDVMGVSFDQIQGLDERGAVLHTVP